MGSDFFLDDRDLAMSDSVYVFIPFSKERARIARDGTDESGTSLRSQQSFSAFGDSLPGGDISRSTPSYQSAAVIPSVAASFPSRTLAPIQAPAPAVIHTPAAPARSSSGGGSSPMRSSSVSLPTAPAVVHVASVSKDPEKPRKPADDADRPTGGAAGGSVAGNGGGKPSPATPVIDVVKKDKATAKPNRPDKPAAAGKKGDKPGKGTIGDVASNKPKKDPVETIKNGVGSVVSKPADKPKGNGKPKGWDKPKPNAPVAGGNSPIVAAPAPAAPVRQAPIPVPDGGSTALMFGAAAALGALVRRWQRR